MQNETESYKGLAWTAAMAFFMQALDSTILNTALPSIAASLNQPSLKMHSAIISYALTVAALIPLSGWLADRFGTRRVFRVAIALFVLGSIACASSQTLNMLVLSRILQGVGGALMMPVARLTILRVVPKNELISAMNLMAMMGLLGPIIGPILGGWLAAHVSWHWIFLINIPIGITGIIVAGKFMPNCQRDSGVFDYKGFLLFAFGLVGLTYGLEMITESLSNVPQGAGLIFGALCLLGSYVFYARQHLSPLLPLNVFRTRTFRIGLTVNMLFRLSSSATPFLLPLMLQVAFTFSADMVGWMLAPIAIGSLLMKRFTKPILHRFGYKRTLIANSVVMTAIILSFGLLGQHFSTLFYLCLATIYGLSVSLMFTAINTLTICDLDDSLAAAGSTMLSVVQQVGIGFGIALSSVMLSIYHNVGGEALPQAFSHTFYTSSVLAILLIVLLRRLHAKDGENLSS